MTDAELRNLLTDCLVLWGVPGRPEAGAEGWHIETAEGVFSLAPAAEDDRPARWFYRTPERRVAGRPPRAAASIGAALSALRNALGAAPGQRLRVG